MTMLDWIVPLGVAVVTLVLLISTLRAGRREPAADALRTDDTSTLPFAVRVTPAVAIIVSALFTVTALVYIGTVWFAPSADFTLMTAPFRPIMLPNFFVDGDNSQAATGGGLTHGRFTVEGMDSATKTWTTLATATWTAMFVSAALTVARLARAVRRGAGSTAAIARAFTLLGFIVVIAGVLWQWFDQMAGYSAALHVYGTAWIDGSWPLDEANTVIVDFTWPRAEFALNIDFWPLWAGLALGVLAAIFRYGARLQKDTEGLV